MQTPHFFFLGYDVYLNYHDPKKAAAISFLDPDFFLKTAFKFSLKDKNKRTKKLIAQTAGALFDEKKNGPKPSITMLEIKWADNSFRKLFFRREVW